MDICEFWSNSFSHFYTIFYFWLRYFSTLNCELRLSWSRVLNDTAKPYGRHYECCFYVEFKNMCVYRHIIK